jgi:hypothetical protein
MKYIGIKKTNVDMSIAFRMLREAVAPINIPSHRKAENVINGMAHTQ